VFRAAEAPPGQAAGTQLGASPAYSGPGLPRTVVRHITRSYLSSSNQVALWMVDRRRLHAIEQGDVRRRAAVALIRMPAAPVREPDGQGAVRGQRRFRALGGGLAGRRGVGDHQDLRHLGVHLVPRGQGAPVVLDLRAEQLAEAHQLGGISADFVKAGQQQEAVAVVERLADTVGLALQGRDRIRRREREAPAEGRTVERMDGEVGHAGSPAFGSEG
jgi:hypothetical protein